MSKINKEKQAAMPQKVIKELFEYNGETGGWVWIKKPHPNSPIKVGQSAGWLDKSTGYIRITIKGHKYQAHRLAWVYTYGDYPDGEQPYIDHINGKRDDNRIANLRVSSNAENVRNQQMRSDNPSGVTGVLRIYRPNNSKKNPKIHYYWMAHWHDENGKLRTKTFKIEKLGEEVAKQMAIDYRAEQLRLLELDYNIVYSERHGT